MIVQNLPGKASLQTLPAARLVALIGLTLALGYAVVLAGAYS